MRPCHLDLHPVIHITRGGAQHVYVYHVLEDSESFATMFIRTKFLDNFIDHDYWLLNTTDTDCPSHDHDIYERFHSLNCPSLRSENRAVPCRELITSLLASQLPQSPHHLQFSLWRIHRDHHQCLVKMDPRWFYRYRAAMFTLHAVSRAGW